MNTDLELFELEDVNQQSREEEIVEDYLKELGVEQYDFEQYIAGSPGKYYDDIPLDKNPEAFFDTLATQTCHGKHHVFTEDTPFYFEDGDLCEYDIDAAFSVHGPTLERFRFEDEESIANQETVSTSTQSSGKRVSFRDAAIVVEEPDRYTLEKYEHPEEQQTVAKSKKSKRSSFFKKKGKEKNEKSKLPKDEFSIEEAKSNVEISEHFPPDSVGQTLKNKRKPGSPHGSSKLKLIFPSLERKTKHKKSSPDKQISPSDEEKKRKSTKNQSESRTSEQSASQSCNLLDNIHVIPDMSPDDRHKEVVQIHDIPKNSKGATATHDHNMEAQNLFTDICEYLPQAASAIDYCDYDQTPTDIQPVIDNDDALYSKIYRPAARTFHIPFAESYTDSANTHISRTLEFSEQIDEIIKERKDLKIQEFDLPQSLNDKFTEEESVSPQISRSRTIKDEVFFDSLPESCVDGNEGANEFSNNSAVSVGVDISNGITKVEIEQFDSRTHQSRENLFSNTTPNGFIQPDENINNGINPSFGKGLLNASGIISSSTSYSDSLFQMESKQEDGKFSEVIKAITDDEKNALEMELSKFSNEQSSSWVDDSGNNLLHVAVGRDGFECVKLLYSCYPDLLKKENKFKLTPVAESLRLGRIDTFDWLLDHADVIDDLKNQSPKRNIMHHAAKYGQDGCLRLLLNKLTSDNCTLDSFDSRGDTPSHLAAKYGHLTCLQTMVEYGVDVTLQNKAGYTPCAYADANNQRQCVGYLMLVESCLPLAREYLSSKKQLSRLRDENKSLKKILEQFNDVVISDRNDDVRNHLSCLEDEFDEITDSMSAQMEGLYRENCNLREKNNGKMRNVAAEDKMRDSLDKATCYRSRLKKLGKLVTQTQHTEHVQKFRERFRSHKHKFSQSENPVSQDASLTLKELLRNRMESLRNNLFVSRADTLGRDQKLNIANQNADYLSRDEGSPVRKIHKKPAEDIEESHVESGNSIVDVQISSEILSKSDVLSEDYGMRRTVTSDSLVENINKDKDETELTFYTVVNSDTNSVPSIQTLAESESTYGYYDVTNLGVSAHTDVNEVVVLGVLEGDEDSNDNQSFDEDVIEKDLQENLLKDEYLRNFLDQSEKNADEFIFETVSREHEDYVFDIQNSQAFQDTGTDNCFSEDVVSREDDVSFKISNDDSSAFFIDNTIDTVSTETTSLVKTIPKKKPRPSDKPVPMLPFLTDQNIDSEHLQHNKLLLCAGNIQGPEDVVADGPNTDSAQLDDMVTDIRFLPSYRTSPFESRLSTIEEMSVQGETFPESSLKSDMDEIFGHENSSLKEFGIIEVSPDEMSDEAQASRQEMSSVPDKQNSPCELNSRNTSNETTEVQEEKPWYELSDED